MSEPTGRLEQVLGHWMPRIQVAGISAGDATRLVREAGEWPRWCETWSAEGERHVAMAEEDTARGRLITAGEAYLRAALFFHFGQFMFFDDLKQKERAAQRKVETYALAAPLLLPPAEAVRVPFEKGHLTGYLRRPAGGPAPLVILIPGSDSTKEEFSGLELHFLNRGLATLSVDGPGQGEGRALGLQRPDWGPVLQPICRHVAGDAHLTGKIGVMGMAFGGHLALQGAGSVIESGVVQEIGAVICMNGFFDLGSFWERLPEVYRANMGYALGGADQAETGQRAKGFSLENTPPPGCPALVLHGGLDRIFPLADARRIAETLGSGATFVEFPDGNHVCNNIAYRYRPLMADWMAEQLGGRLTSTG